MPLWRKWKLCVTRCKIAWRKFARLKIISETFHLHLFILKSSVRWGENGKLIFAILPFLGRFLFDDDLPVSVEKLTTRVPCFTFSHSKQSFYLIFLFQWLPISCKNIRPLVIMTRRKRRILTAVKKTKRDIFAHKKSSHRGKIENCNRNPKIAPLCLQKLSDGHQINLRPLDSNSCWRWLQQLWWFEICPKKSLFTCGYHSKSQNCFDKFLQEHKFDLSIHCFII